MFVEIVPGVYAVDFNGLVWAYLYREADRLALIDAGIAGGSEAILQTIRSIGLRPTELFQVIVTHYHRDHVGSIAELTERTSARVLAHRLDAAVIRGEQPELEPLLSEPERILHEKIAKDVPPANWVRVDRELEDGDEIDLGAGARVIHVPGHTPGSIAVYVPNRRILFTGDAVASVNGTLVVGVFNVDPKLARDSVRKLAELDFEVACCGHGPPMDRGASLAFRRLVEHLP